MFNAPNGKPSNLNETQWKLVRTPEFKSWFGDWEKLAIAKVKDPAMDEVTLANLSKDVSKVLDENGEPLVVYHTVKEEYNGWTKFKTVNDGNEIGSHFGTLEQAQHVANNALVDNPKMFLCFLNIKNPLKVDDMGFWTANNFKFIFNNNKIQYKESGDFHGAKFMKVQDVYDALSSKNIDGLMYRNIYEGSGFSYSVFYPNQIKLADGTNGTFDDSNLDIRYDGGGEVNSNLFMKWYVQWYKGISDKMNIVFYLPSVIAPYKEENVVVLDVFEKINQNIDAKPYLKEIVEKADEYGVVIYLEPTPRHNRFQDNLEKKKKITREYLIEYYKRFDFQLTPNKQFMKRLPKSNPDIRYNNGGIVDNSNYFDSTRGDFEPISKSDAIEIMNEYVKWRRKKNKPEFIQSSKFGNLRVDYESEKKSAFWRSRSFSFYFISEDNTYIIRISDHWSKSSYPKSNKLNCGFIRSCYWTNFGEERFDFRIPSETYSSYLLGGLCYFRNFQKTTSNPDIRFDNGGLVAPNGKKSNLTPEQYKLVRTKAFKDWFGDWENDPENASKVVDDNGEPLMVYHGSRSDVRFAFPIFDIGKYDISFFTNNKRVAEWFSGGSSHILHFEELKIPNYLNQKSSIDDLLAFYKEKIDPTAFLVKLDISDGTIFYRLRREDDSISSPLGENIEQVKKELYKQILYGVNTANNSKSRPFYRVFLKIKKPYVIDAKGNDFMSIPFENGFYDAESVIKKIKNKGKNDGVIIKNNIEGTDAYYQKAQDTYSAFEPNQIKLADGTNTTFDVSNPDIRFNNGGKMKSVSNGTITVGASHEDGGIPVYNKGTGQMLEVEGGEGIVNKRSMSSQEKVNLDGKKLTICEAVSELNQKGGGVKFDCDIMDNKRYSYNNGGEFKKGKKMELEHKDTLDKLYAKEITTDEAVESIVKEHLQENPKYYSSMEKFTPARRKKKTCACTKKYYEDGGDIFDLGIGSMDSFVRSQISKEKRDNEDQEIIDWTINEGRKMLDTNILSSLMSVDAKWKPYFAPYQKFNLYELGWRLQFGSSRQWAGLCSWDGELKKNIYLSIQFVKHDRNWKQNAIDTIHHEIAHACVTEAIISKVGMIAYRQIDPLYFANTGHGDSWKSICQALNIEGDCSVFYTKSNKKPSFLPYKYECANCFNKGYGNRITFTNTCFKCFKPVTPTKNLV